MGDRSLVGVLVVLAEPARHRVVPLRLPQGATVADAVASSGLLAGHAASECDSLAFGIFGKVVDEVRRLEDGDRVEILRPLPQDPKSRRRTLAREGRTMGDGSRTKRD